MTRRIGILKKSQPDGELVVPWTIGDGPLVPQVRAQARLNGAPSRRVLGKVFAEAARCDSGVLPGSGRAALVARVAAFGRPSGRQRLQRSFARFAERAIARASRPAKARGRLR